MKYYKNIDTNEFFSETELKELSNQFYFDACFDSGKEYFDYLVNSGDLLEAKKAYVIVDDCTTAKATVESAFDNKSEALENAIDEWEHLTKADKSKRDAFFVASCFVIDSMVDYETLETIKSFK